MIKEILKDHRPGMSQFQHDHFVTGMSSLTEYGQYKQSVRELYTRVCGLRDNAFAKETLEIELEEQEYISQHGEDTFVRRKAAVELKRKQMAMFDLLKRIEHTERDVMSFYRQASQLKEIIGELTPEKENEFEKEMWESECKKLAAFDVMSQGSIGRPTLEMAFSMKGELRDRLLNELKEPEKLIEGLERTTEKSVNFFNGKQLPQLDFKKLLKEEV